MVSVPVTTEYNFCGDKILTLIDIHGNMLISETRRDNSSRKKRRHAELKQCLAPGTFVRGFLDLRVMSWPRLPT